MLLARSAAIAAAGLALALSLPAAEGAAVASPAKSCFYVSQISNTRAADARTLYVKAGGGAIYRLTMKNDCDGMVPPAETIILEPSSSGQICNPLDVNIKVGSHGVRSSCLVDSITRLSPDEVALLPKSSTP